MKTAPISTGLEQKLGGAFLVAMAIFFVVVMPSLNAFVPAGSALHISDFTLNLFGKFLAYAILALGLDLIWGYTGILSLGHGVFFGLGGYCMGMYLSLAIGAEGWRASYDMPGTFDPVGDPRPLMVDRQGHDGAGEPATVTDVLTVMGRVREPWPNDQSWTPSDVALSDMVYAGDLKGNI